MNKLEGKIAVVTGASKGIGASIAKRLAVEGATVVVNYSTSRAGADRVVADIDAAGGQAIALGANLSVETEVVAFFAAVKAQLGRVDILVNNAGVYEFGPLSEVTTASFRKMFDTNVLGLLLVTREAVALMPAAGGSIVNISSAASALAPPMASVYVATKGAVDVITRSLAKELAGRHIRVNAISPGYVLTEGTATAGIPDSDMERMLISLTPLGRAGNPDDIAGPVAFLVSDDARYVTGDNVFASGGAGR